MKVDWNTWPLRVAPISAAAPDSRADYYYYYYYYIIYKLHKFKQARVRSTGVVRWGTWLAGKGKEVSFEPAIESNQWMVIA